MRKIKAILFCAFVAFSINLVSKAAQAGQPKHPQGVDINNHAFAGANSTSDSHAEGGSVGDVNVSPYQEVIVTPQTFVDGDDITVAPVTNIEGDTHHFNDHSSTSLGVDVALAGDEVSQNQHQTVGDTKVSIIQFDQIETANYTIGDVTAPVATWGGTIGGTEGNLGGQLTFAAPLTWGLPNRKEALAKAESRLIAETERALAEAAFYKQQIMLQDRQTIGEQRALLLEKSLIEAQTTLTEQERIERLLRTEVDALKKKYEPACECF